MSQESSHFIIVDQDNITGAETGKVNPTQEQQHTTSNYCHALVSSVLQQIGYAVWSKDIRPWSEFFQRKNFALPKNLENAKSRVQRNSSHFYANYVVVILVLAGIALVSQPLLLLGLIAVVQVYRWVESLEEIKLWGSLKIEGSFKSIGIRVLSGTAFVALTIDSSVIVTGVASLIVFLHAILIDGLSKENTASTVAEPLTTNTSAQEL
jgi:hypothetical protein